jgi:hypothetical protein
MCGPPKAQNGNYRLGQGFGPHIRPSDGKLNCFGGMNLGSMGDAGLEPATPSVSSRADFDMTSTESYQLASSYGTDAGSSTRDTQWQTASVSPRKSPNLRVAASRNSDYSEARFDAGYRSQTNDPQPMKPGGMPRPTECRRELPAQPVN